MNRWFWILLAAAAAVYLVIVVWSLPKIAAEAGGLAPFDLRSTGYSLEEAQAFLNALSEAGLAQYQGPQRWLDTLYPVLFAFVLILLTNWLTRERPRWLRLGFYGLILLSTFCDFLENVLVGRMLSVGAEGVTETLVSAASAATLYKFVFATLVMFGLLGLFMRGWLARRGT